MNGDVLPSVTTSQILLRRHRPQATITADGHFGPRTKGAVEGFQSFHSLTRDGIIGDGTWNRFMSVSNFQTIDVVDGTDPSLVALEATDIRAAGGNPIVVFGMSNGIEVMVSQVTARGRPGNVMLLRIHGHGNRGRQNVSAGEIDGAPHLAAISLSNFSQIEGTIARIRTVMLPFGSVQLLGCDVGGGRGSRLVSRLATTWGVPVTAGLHTQFGGGNRTFRFEGPTVTGFPPGAANLRSWSQLRESQFGNQTMPDLTAGTRTTRHGRRSRSDVTHVTLGELNISGELVPWWSLNYWLSATEESFASVPAICQFPGPGGWKVRKC